MMLGFLLSNYKSPDDSTKPNFLLEVVTYCVLRCENLIENCIICDLKIEVPFKSEKPTICTNSKCLFDYMEIKVCSGLEVAINPSSVSSDINLNPNIVDLLISMCYSAATSSRRDIIFE